MYHDKLIRLNKFISRMAENLCNLYFYYYLNISCNSPPERLLNFPTSKYSLSDACVIVCFFYRFQVDAYTPQDSRIDVERWVCSRSRCTPLQCTPLWLLLRSIHPDRPGSFWLREAQMGQPSPALTIRLTHDTRAAACTVMWPKLPLMLTYACLRYADTSHIHTYIAR